MLENKISQKASSLLIKEDMLISRYGHELEDGDCIPGVPTPMVSPREISSQPIFKSSSATYATLAG